MTTTLTLRILELADGLERHPQIEVLDRAGDPDVSPDWDDARMLALVQAAAGEALDPSFESRLVDQLHVGVAWTSEAVELDGEIGLCSLAVPEVWIPGHHPLRSIDAAAATLGGYWDSATFLGPGTGTAFEPGGPNPKLFYVDVDSQLHPLSLTYAEHVDWTLRTRGAIGWQEAFLPHSALPPHRRSLFRMRLTSLAERLGVLFPDEDFDELAERGSSIP